MMNELIERYAVLAVCKEEITAARNILISCYKNGGKLLLCGNGGSCADCEHIAGELMKGFLKMRLLPDELKNEMEQNCPQLDGELLNRLQGGLPAISLTAFTALNSAFCNDVDPELVYAQPLMALAEKNDVLVAISTSGNSKNVVNAAKVAKGLGIKVVALTGASGGVLKELADVCIRVPETETFKVQELHLPVYHFLCAEIEKYFFNI